METIATATVLILLCSLLLFIRRLQSISQISKDVDIQSGISLDYKVFIGKILNRDKTATIESTKVNSVNIRTSGAKDAPVFSLTEVQGRVIIVWTWSAAGFGRRGKEWSFPNTYDQVKMYEEVMDDVIRYQDSVYQKHNLRMPQTA